MLCKGTTAAAKPCKNQAEPDSNYCHLHKNAPIIVRTRCAGISANGRQCKNNTLRGEYCFVHLKARSLRIKESTLPGAGFGLFAIKPKKPKPDDPPHVFVRGENIAPYSGDIVGEEAVEDGDQYLLQTRQDPARYISARRSNTGAGRYANARHRGQGSNNAQLVYDRVGRKAHLRAIKTINPEQEITAAYGGAYWRGAGIADAAEKYISRLA